MTFTELAGRLEGTSGLPVVRATGWAGDVYLCHPFLVHAAQAHHGRTPRFIAQPPLEPAGEPQIDGPDDVDSPVVEAIRLGLGLE